MHSRFFSLTFLRRAALALAVSAVASIPVMAQPAAGAAAPAAAAARPLRVYIRAGLKTHGVGEHDYPQFLADWSKILTERGAVVDGSLHYPSAKELENIDVIVTYKGDAGGTSQTVTDDEKTALEAFLKRGGGLVALHDTICSFDPEWFCSIYGGAKKHGQTNFTLEAPVAYTITDREHPIMKGMADFTITDESFYLMTWAKSPEVHVLATAPQAPTATAVRAGHAGEVVPQIWTYERTMTGASQPFRSFVWMQGHHYANINNDVVQPMLLRAIAWAGKAPIDSLSTVRAGRGGGRGRAGGAAPRIDPIGGGIIPEGAPAAPAAPVPTKK